MLRFIAAKTTVTQGRFAWCRICFIWIVLLLMLAQSLDDERKRAKKVQTYSHLYSMCFSPWQLRQFEVHLETSLQLRINIFFALKLSRYPDQSYREGQQGNQPTTLQTLTRTREIFQPTWDLWNCKKCALWYFYAFSPYIWQHWPHLTLI